MYYIITYDEKDDVQEWIITFMAMFDEILILNVCFSKSAFSCSVETYCRDASMIFGL